MKTQKRFEDRIGKRIYRDTDGCKCESCKDIVKNGLIVHDKDHANYLFDIQNEWGIEGLKLNYRDSK